MRHAPTLTATAVPVRDLRSDSFAPGGVAVGELCFYGLCGGAGVTSVTEAVGFGRDGSRLGLPEPAPGQTVPMVAVTRSHAHGLARAQREAARWAAHGPDGPWHQVGLVVVADAPGRLPKPLRELLHLVSGGWPRLWRIAWSEALRLGDPPTTLADDPAVQTLRTGLHAPLSETRTIPGSKENRR